MSDRLSRRTETFIVRLWTEYLEQTPPTWRGEIEHVGRWEVMRFGGLREMSDQIRRCARKGHLSDKKETEVEDDKETCGKKSSGTLTLK